jgi:CDP-diacylglycerol--glycerol-3-phosphate 3-phosphatidyltransferase
LIANVITILRIALIPLIITLLLKGFSLIAFALFLTAALSDWLDGYLARRLNQTSDFGKNFDPVADKILVIGILGTLVLIGQVSWAPFLIIVIREAAIVGFRIKKTNEGHVFGALFLGKAKTVAQLVAVGMLILKLPCAAEALWIAVGLSVVSGIEYVRKF